ncbi:MAG: hypothetical protein ABJO86_00580 [Lentilitoribacter sp.]
MRITKEFYLPKSATKITQKTTGCEVYAYTDAGGLLCAMAFKKRSVKPVWSFYFKSDEARTKRVEKFFADQQAHKESVAERRAKQNQPHNLQVDHILDSMWGYEQTNINYYQITKLIGKNYVEVREISAVSETTDWMQGTCTPKMDSFISEPMKRKVINGCVKINDCERATLWNLKPNHWTSYA